MNENDNKVRKQWLALWALSLVMAITNHLLMVFFNPSLSMAFQVQLWSTAFALAGIILFGFAGYRCVYKKPGTKLLIFCLVCTVGTLVTNLALYLNGTLNPPAYIPYHGAFWLMTQGTGVLWIIACWRMLKVNKRLQAIAKPSA